MIKSLYRVGLNLSTTLKNKENKGFLKDYLRKYQIPISKTPDAGFGKQNVIPTQGELDKFYKNIKFV